MKEKVGKYVFHGFSGFVDFACNYLAETAEIIRQLDLDVLERIFLVLRGSKNDGGRVFFIGAGGGAGTGSHATNDFLKIAKIPAICLTDNASLLTALANDEGIESVFVRQLEMHRFAWNDCLFVYSVGGGGNGVSENIVSAVQYAKQIGGAVVGVVGRNHGFTAQHGDAVLVVPNVAEDRVTAHTEDLQMIVDHLIVNALGVMYQC